MTLNSAPFISASFCGILSSCNQFATGFPNWVQHPFYRKTVKGGWKIAIINRALRPIQSVISRTGVDPNVGTVQGRDAFTETLYGTTNNGAGCVLTEDEISWVSTTCAFIDDHLEGRWWYKKAGRLNIRESRPYAIGGLGKES